MSVTIDYSSLLPDTKSTGRPKATVGNLAEICRRVDIAVRYNTDTQREEIRVRDRDFTADHAAWGALHSECAKFDFPTYALSRLVRLLAYDTEYTPLVVTRGWRPEDPLGSRIRAELDWEQPVSRWSWMTAAELVQAWIDPPSFSDVCRAGRIVRRLNGRRVKRTANRRTMLVPPLRSEQP